MRIVIAGIGDVGFHIAKLLSDQKQDIIIIDQDKEKLKYADEHLDAITFKGNSSSFNTLKKARIDEADLFLAVTNSDEVNLTSCMIAKKMGADRCIARISDAENNDKEQQDFFVEMGIDNMIFPEDIAAKEIARLITKAEFAEFFNFQGDNLSLGGLAIKRGAPIAGKSLEESKYLNEDRDFIPVAILRKNETIIPRKDTVIEEDDLVYFIMEPQAIYKVSNLAGIDHFEVKNVMILGGGKIGENSSKILQNQYQVKLIESDQERCFELAEELPSTLVIHGDGRDIEMLEDEDLNNMDAFVALSGDAETNIISSIVAKNHGVRKTIALVDNIDYINISQNIGIDTLINKKLIAANNIFRYIRKGEVTDLLSLPGTDIEIMEFIVTPESKIKDQELKNLGFPKEAIIGGVIRNNKGIISMGDFQFKENDHVIVVAKPSAIEGVESFFANS